MSKLEEQLRKSRKQERSDLQPPAGGWEAIQASLAATAAGAATAAEGAAASTGGAMGAAGTSAAAGAKASLLVTSLKALLGLFVVGGLAIGAWVTFGSDDTPEREVAAKAITVAPATTDGPSIGNESIGNGQVTAGNDAGVAALNPEDQPGKPAGLVSAPTAETLARRNANKLKQGAPRQLTEQPTSPQLENPVETAAGEDQPIPSANATGGRSEAANTAIPVTPADPVAEEAGLPSPTGEVTSDDPPATPRLPNEVDGPAINESAATPIIGFSEVSTPVASLGSMAIEPLSISPIENVTNSSGIVFTGFESLVSFGDLSEEGKTFRKFKRPAIAEWQYHFASSINVARQQFSFGRAPILERVPSGTGAETFTLPNGEVVDANYILFSVGSEFTNVDNVLVRGGLTRQTIWGGAFRGSLGLYQGVREFGANANTLLENQVGLQFREKSQAAFLELGFHYTFMRRQRFRPYVGIDGMSYLFYNVKRQENFFDQQTGLESPRADFTATEATRSFSLDLAVTAGFQYRFSPRLSVGAFAWANYGYDFHVDAPFGLEVRYSFQ